MASRAIVVGGSLGGLTAALLLRDLGWDTLVFERSKRPLEARGVGIVAHPASIRYLVERRDTDLSTMTAASHYVRYMDASGAIVHEAGFDYRFTSFFALYRELLAGFDRDRYRLAHEVTGFREDPGRVVVETAGGDVTETDLLVFADGIHSTGRRLVAPEAQQRYAGYVAWRGVVSERDLTAATFARLHESIVYSILEAGHILSYPIPSTDGSVEPGHRLINWIWYRNRPEDAALEALADQGPNAGEVVQLRDAAREDLAPPLAEMVTRSAAPFVQVVFDVELPRLATGRACLIGDAAFVLRPHVAVGTAKAAEAAWRLAAAIEATGDDVPAVLRAWEPGQLALERSVLGRTRRAGDRVQFEHDWRVGEPLPFGLYEQGDSAMPHESMTKETT
jgi:2,6-dihydroxypyridine 3-monooxygenase